MTPPARSPSTSPLGVDLETPPGQIPVNFPLGCEPWRPPGQIPSTSSLGVGLETPHPARSPSTSTLGVGLETCKACWYTTPQTCCKACWDTSPPPPVNRMTDRCKNITFPQTSIAGGNYTVIVALLLTNIRTDPESVSNTRMHSSRMRTVRLFTVSSSIPCVWG